MLRLLIPDFLRLLFLGRERRHGSIVSCALVVGILSALPIQATAQQPIELEELTAHAAEILETTLIEFLFVRDSVERRDGNRPTLKTLLGESDGGLLLSVYMDEEAAWILDRLDYVPDLQEHAELLASAMTRLGVRTWADDGPVDERCVYHRVPGPPDQRGSLNWSECDFPPGIAAMVRLGYPYAMGSEEGVEWVIVPGTVHFARDRNPDGVGMDRGHLFTARLEYDGATWRVTHEVGAVFITRRPRGDGE